MNGNSDVNYLDNTKHSVQKEDRNMAADSHSSATPKRFIFILCLTFGLCLYVTDVGLHVTIAAKYLTMRNCSRNHQHTIVNFQLNKWVDLNKLLSETNGILEEAVDGSVNDANLPEGSGLGGLVGEGNLGEPQDDLTQDDIDKLISTKVGQFINETLSNNIYVKLRKKVFQILPEHWKQRIIDIVSFQVSRHSISSIPDICMLNNNQNLTRLSQMALYVCQSTFDNGTMDSREGRAVQNAIQELVPTRAKEDMLIQAAMQGDVMKVLDEVLGGDESIDLQRLHKLIARFQKKFNDPNDLKVIFDLISDPKIAKNMGNLTAAIGAIDPKHLNGAADALAKIDPKNVVIMEKLLGQLNITLATLIVDPAIFLSFLGDPTKGKILAQLQKYLPTLEPEDINDFLHIKIEIDNAMWPDADAVFRKVLNLPVDTLQKVSGHDSSK